MRKAAGAGETGRVAVAGVTFERIYKIPLTERLTSEQVQALLPHVEVVSLPEGEVLFEQGDLAVYIYYVEQGLVAEVQRVPVQPSASVPQGAPGGQPSTKEVVLRYAGQGEYLGRYALITGQPFRVSAVAEVDSVLLAIPLRYAQPFLFAHEDWRSWFLRTDIATRLRAVPLFMGLGDWDIYRLADATKVTDHAAQTPIFEVGDEAECLYVVDQGQVVEPLPPPDVPGEDWPRYFGPGNFFGQSSMRSGQERQTRTIARLPTRLFCISEQTLENLLADRLDDVLKDQVRVDLPSRLREIPQFSNLTKEHLHLLSGYVCLECHRPGDIVARQGEPATGLMMLVEGEAVVRLQFGKGQPRTVTHLQAHPRASRVGSSGGNYFGNHALLDEELRGATVEVTRPSVWLVLHRDDFQHFMRDTGLSRADLKRGPTSDLPLPYKVRQHWVVPVSRILPLALLMVLLLLLMASDLLAGSLFVVGVILLIGTAAAMLYFAIDWLDDTLEVTARTVIHGKRKLLLNLEWDEIPLHQIQDVEATVNRIGQWFGADDLVITAEGAKNTEGTRDKGKEIVFRMTPSPDSVRDLILTAVSDEVWATEEFDLRLPRKVRRHWLVPVSRILPLALLVVLILELMASGVLGGALGALGAVMLLGTASVLAYFAVAWLDDVLEVKPQSVIYSRRKLTKLERTEIPLYQIRNVTVTVSTVGGWYSAGKLIVDSAGPTGQTVVTQIPSPPAARDLILMAAASRDAQAGAPAPSPEGDLPLPYKVRRHWVWPLIQILPLAAIVFVIVMLMGAGILGGMLLPVGASLLAVFGFGILYRFADWLNDTYEVTTRAVIHTEKRLFLSQERYEIPLQQIQNVNLRVGVIGRYLGFGNLAIDTAAAKGQISFTTIPRPAYVQELIQKASAQARSGLTVQRQESIRQQIEEQLYPERLKPSVPGSALIPPQVPPAKQRRILAPLRAFGGWLPRFEIREDGKVTWRKHWINLLQRTGVQFLVFLVSIYVALSVTLAAVTTLLGLSVILLPPVIWFGFQAWMFLPVLLLSILAALWFIYQYVDWRNDIYIVTDDEVIDVERDLAMYPFFFLYTESRRQASLSNVQYVDLKIPNPLAMILNYGHVIVRTAGAEGTLDFLWVSNPRNVHAEILRRLTAFEEREREREFQERWGDMPRWFESYRDVLDQTNPRDG